MMQRLSPRVAVCPHAHEPAPVDDGTLLLRQLAAPGGRFVFGDGSHPTTRLCAGAVDQFCRERGPAAVLDVGTGTGILARIAHARGARFVAGTDIDAPSLELARANAALDAGGGAIHFGAEPPDHWGARFDLAVANILEQPLVALAPALRAALAPGGTLLISGFTRLQAPSLRLAFEAAGCAPVREAALGEWLLLAFEARR